MKGYQTSIVTLILIFITIQLFSQSKKAAQADSAKPFVLGLVDELASRELGEKRVLNIYLPEGYNPDDSVAYPVTYLLDGSADEDFIHGREILLTRRRSRLI